MSYTSSTFSNKSIVFTSNTSPYPISSFNFNPSNGFTFVISFKYSPSLQINSNVFFISQSNNTNFNNNNNIYNITNITNYFELTYTSINTFTLLYQSNNNVVNPSSNITTSVSFTINPDQIYNIVITYDITGTPSMRVYIDSVLYSGSTINSPTVNLLPSQGNFNFNFIGGAPNVDGTFNYIIPFIGNIYTFSVYPRSFTQLDVNQTFNTDLSLSTISTISTSSSLLANPKLSITYQLSNPSYINTLSSSNIPIFDNISKSVIFRGQHYLQYAQNLQFSYGFTIFITFKFYSTQIINNETLMTIIQNPQIGQIANNSSSIPLQNSIIIQRYGTSNNLIIYFINANNNSTSSLITKNTFLKGIIYNLTFTFDGSNIITVYVNGNIDNQTYLLL